MVYPTIYCVRGLISSSFSVTPSRSIGQFFLIGLRFCLRAATEKLPNKLANHRIQMYFHGLSYSICESEHFRELFFSGRRNWSRNGLME